MDNVLSTLSPHFVNVHPRLHVVLYKHNQNTYTIESPDVTMEYTWVFNETSPCNVPLETQKDSVDTAQFIPNLIAREGQMVNATPLPLYPGKEPRYPL